MLEKQGDKFIYSDKPEGEVTKLDVHYTKGGTNYFSGGYTPRGIYVSIRTTTIKQENGFKSESFTLFGGNNISCLALRLERKSDKQLLRVADLVSPHAAELVERFIANPTAAKVRLSELLAPLTGVAA
jgi:hypothetical protein